MRRTISELMPKLIVINILLIKAGLWVFVSWTIANMIGPDEIRDIVLSDVSLEEKAQTLIRFANNAGGLDNITVVLLHFTEEDAA